LRPVLMAGALLAVLVLAALFAAWVTGPSGPNTFTLTVLKPTGGTLTGSGITCGTGGTSCSTSVKDGQIVELRADADEGYTFAGYTLDCAPSGRLEMKAAHSCGARFERAAGSSAAGSTAADGRRWTLTLTPPENGTIVTLEGHECGPRKKACTVDVLEGTIVSLEVMPEPGFRVQSYTGDCVDGTANMTQARNCGVALVKGDGPSLAPTPRTSSAAPAGPGAPRVTRNEPTPTPAQPRPEQSVATATPPAASPERAPQRAETAPASEPPAAAHPAAPPSPRPGPSNEPPAPVRTAAGREGDKEAAEKIANADIQRVLKAYRSAYERMDIPALKRLQPGINVASHELQFRDLKTVKYTFGGDPQIEDLDVEVGRARALVDLKTENEQKSGKKQKPLEGKATYLLKRIGEGKDWEIVEVRYAMNAK
jgi:hypothetical protein